MLDIQRQLHGKGRPLTWCARCVDSPTVLRYDLLAYGQSQPSALDFSGEQWLEDLYHLLITNAGAGILEHHFSIVSGLASADGQHTPNQAWRPGRCRPD